MKVCNGCYLLALNNALKDEIQHLKVLTGQAMPSGGPMMNFPPYGSGQQFYPNSQAMHTLLTAQQFQQLQMHSQKQQQQQHHLHQLQQQQKHIRQEQKQQQLRDSMPPDQKDGNAEDPPSVKME